MKGFMPVPGSANLRYFSITGKKIFKMSLNHSDVELESLSLPHREHSHIQPPDSNVVRAGDSASIPVITAKSPAQQYFNRHRIIERVDEAINQIAEKLPDDPYSFLAALFSKASRQNKVQLSITSFEIINYEPPLSNSLKTSPNEIEIGITPPESNKAFPSYISNVVPSIKKTTT